MRTVAGEPCPLPEHPALADVARAMNDARTWGFIVDRGWSLVYMTEEIRLSNGGLQELVPLPLDVPWFSEEGMEVCLGWSGGIFTLESWRVALAALAGWMVADTPGGAPAVRNALDPRLAGAVADSVVPEDRAALAYFMPASYSAGGEPLDVQVSAVRLRDDGGGLAGTAFFSKPAAGMSVLGTIASAGDLGHFERMQLLARHARRPAAMLFADLEGSSSLARRLSTASYFALERRIVRAADRCVVDAGGMIGRHVGDGVVAFFLAETAGSESAAARACIEATDELRRRLTEVAERSDLSQNDVVLRFGLHWGSTLHIGQIATAARVEVNALGDEVNEAARIEACATGGRALASKALLERLDREDADALGLSPGRLTYTPLGELDTATEKARRDAPSIAVCDLARERRPD